PRRAAAVPVRLRESFDRRAPHEKALEDAFVDERHLLSRHALVVEPVVAVEGRLAEALPGRIVDHGDELRHDRLPDLLPEGTGSGRPGSASLRWWRRRGACGSR